METGKADSWHLYLCRSGMVDINADMHAQQQNVTYHEETNCETDYTVSKLHRIVLCTFGIPFDQAGFH